MATTRAVLEHQKAIGQSISKASVDFGNIATERKNVRFVEEKLKWLENQWAIFATNDMVLKEAIDIDGSHEYFSKEVLKESQQKYLEFRNHLIDYLKLMKDLQEKEAFIEDDFDQDGASNYGGGDKHKSKENINQVKEIVTSDNFYTKVTSNFGGEWQPNSREIINPNVKDFFKNAANRSGVETSMKLISTMDEVMDSFKHYLSGYKELKKKNATNKELRAGNKLLTQKWESLRKLQDNLINLPEYNPKPFLEVENEIFEIFLEAEELQEDKENKNGSAKLPKLEIPKFEGNYTKYISFKQLFERMIGSKNDLDDCEKFAYLKGQLTGEPLTMVSHLTIENKSYKAAWKPLDKRFNNKHAIITQLLKTVQNLEPIVRNSADSLRKTVNTMSECVTTLMNMGMPMIDWINYLFFHLLENKLDGRTRAIYENTLINPAEPRKYEDLMEFLNTRLQNVIGSTGSSS